MKTHNENLVGAKTGAGSAEVRNSGADRPQSQQRRGVQAGMGAGTKCGKSADKVRNLYEHNVSLLIPHPIATPAPLPAVASRKSRGRPRAVSDRAPCDAAPYLVPAVPPKTRRKGGPARPHPHGAAWPANAPRCQLPGMAAHELAVIDAALAIVALKLREPGAMIDGPHKVKEYMRLHLASAERERFAVLFVDARCAAIAFEVMFEGTLTHASVYPREVVRRALHLNAAAVVLAHDHPSGSPEPSRADECLTHALKAALTTVDVRVVDHIVIGGMESVSFAERGLM